MSETCNYDQQQRVIIRLNLCMEITMKEFLLELADLMEKYGVTAEAVNDDADYYPSVAGVKFEEGWCDPHKDYKTIQTGVEFGPVELRELANT